MIKQQQIMAMAAAITLLTIGGLASATDNDNRAFENELNSCITEIGDHANYDEATRIRHIVVKIERTRRRYVFSIDTFVFTDSDETAVREYASYCVARGDEKPVKFRIDEISA